MKTTNEGHEVALQSVQYLMVVVRMAWTIAFYCAPIELIAQTQSPYWNELSFSSAVVEFHGDGNGPHGNGVAVDLCRHNHGYTTVVDGGSAAPSGPRETLDNKILVLLGTV
jgi:hypothetical protein